MEFFKINEIFISLGLLVSAYFLLRRNPRLKHYLKKLGGPPSIPVLGCTLTFLRPHCEYLDMFGNFIKQYGLIFGFWIGNFIPYVVVGDADIIEKLLSSTNHLEKGKYEYSLLHNWLGTGLLTAPRSKWMHRRKLITPAFHFKMLEDFMPVFNEQTNILLDCLEKEISKNPGKVIDLYPFLARCTLDIICETAMGKKIYAQTDLGSVKTKEYVEAVNGMCSLLVDKNVKPWLRIPLIYHLSSTCRKENKYLGVIKRFTEEVIKARKSERLHTGSDKSQKNSTGEGEDASKSIMIYQSENALDGIYGKKRKAFLDLLLDVSQNGSILNDADVREEVDTFMFAGYDTTAVSLLFTIFLLASNYEYQDKIHKELDEVFSDDLDRDVTSADLAKLKYLDCCLKESIRLFPSVPLILRQTKNDLQLDNGEIIPKGATALITIYYAHRNPKYFPEPEKFKPERFLEENPPHKKNPYSWIPFSAGGRNCIGQKFAMTEEKVLLAKLFRKYKIQAVDKLENLKIVPALVLRCENGLKVLLFNRNS